jgi:hypothetical protein
MRQGNILNEATAVSLATFLGEAIRASILIDALHIGIACSHPKLKAKAGERLRSWESWPEAKASPVRIVTGAGAIGLLKAVEASGCEAVPPCWRTECRTKSF